MMAVTTGQGNPNWTRDETILALDLYFDCEGRIPSPTDPRIIELSETLNRLPIHALEYRKANFRNPDGVAFKLQNLRSVGTGTGLQNTSKMDREVWAIFADSPLQVRAISNNIRALIDQFSDSTELDSEIDDTESFTEGKLYTAIHYRRERAPGLRKKLIKARTDADALACDCCGLRSADTTLRKAQDIFECHHIVPISTTGSTETKLTDVALLCANCHRALHSAIRTCNHWIGVDEFKKSELTSTST